MIVRPRHTHQSARGRGNSRRAPQELRHRAQIEAEDDTRLPTWWWFAAPVFFVAVIALSAIWPWGWAPGVAP